MRRRSLLASLAMGMALSLVLSSVVLGASGHRTVKVFDRCDPATFNAVIGPGTCVAHHGKTTPFGDFIAQVAATGAAKGWEFKKANVKIKAGGVITAVDRGGEFHTFTEVAAFGGGCVDALNFGRVPVPECADPNVFANTGVAPGGSVKTGPLAAGVHLFQCLIHPWMRTVAVAEGRHDDDD
jgi:plastocyanin